MLVSQRCVSAPFFAARLARQYWRQKPPAGAFVRCARREMIAFATGGVFKLYKICVPSSIFSASSSSSSTSSHRRLRFSGQAKGATCARACTHSTFIYAKWFWHAQYKSSVYQTPFFFVIQRGHARARYRRKIGMLS